MIRTVAGDIPISDLGHCQPHEHLYIIQTPALKDHKELRINRLSDSVAELKSYREAGGCSLVDVQPLASGRDALALYDAQRLSGVNIIASTGYHMIFFYPEDHWIFNKDEIELAELFTSEINTGMYADGNYFYPQYQTKIKAGAVKAVLDKKGIGIYKKLLRASGRSACISGVPMILHTEMGIGAIEAINLLGRIGLPPERILVCHVDRQTSNRSIHYEIAKTGAYLVYDSITMFQLQGFIPEIELIQDMILHGFTEQILISTDPTVDRLKNYEGRVGIDFILTEFLPILKRNGVSDEEIDLIIRKNPAKALQLK